MTNNWYVITGSPSSGKTTILRELEKLGYKVQYEWARIYIDEEISKGKTLSDIRKDEQAFQKKVLELKMDFEKKLDPNEIIFMERGIPDSIAYDQLAGVPQSALLKKALKNCSYKKIFIMELLKYQTDYARTESEEEAHLLEELFETSYRSLGMEVLKVPKVPIEDRVKFILKNL